MESSEKVFCRANLIKLGMYLDVSRRDLSIGATFRSIRAMVAKIWSNLPQNGVVFAVSRSGWGGLVVGCGSARATQHP